ncbi:MAG: hypothetical protein UY96_C0009G0002 [Parcubacteria group bacterium GW2011_GWB1_56_8]|nr:MAG: hypothetical protein UY96_C0009G0002 [Parcubacteria group bacterium GW2011_GWB1_56_8]
MQCPNCKCQMPGSFDLFEEEEGIQGGKNEQCPKCRAVLWIPCPWARANGRLVFLGDDLSPRLVDFPAGDGIERIVLSGWRERTRI